MQEKIKPSLQYYARSLGCIALFVACVYANCEHLRMNYTFLMQDWENVNLAVRFGNIWPIRLHGDRIRMLKMEEDTQEVFIEVIRSFPCLSLVHKLHNRCVLLGFYLRYVTFLIQLDVDVDIQFNGSGNGKIVTPIA